ncbi:hypothetical protein Q2T40_04925 [Winogradskyella maritima]|nr:hypothetical protein [Winogradskyella maritima]
MGTDENPNYVENTINVDARTYNNRYYERDNVEAAKYDASYTKLREASIGYSFPKKITDRLSLTNLRYRSQAEIYYYGRTTRILTQKQ